MIEPTPLGKLLRLIRVEVNFTQSQLADKLNTTASFISAVETGKKGLPETMVTVLLSDFQLLPETSRKLKAFAAIQKESFSVKVDRDTTWEKRKLAYLFSKKLGDLSDQQVEAIVDILTAKKGK